MVAEIPILCTGRSRIVSSKEIVSARWTPRLVGTKECISSIIIHSTFETMGWNRGEEIAIAILSGVVIKMWGGFLNIFCLSDWGVSPVRSPTLIFPWALSGKYFFSISSRGPIKFFCISFAKALIGEMYKQYTLCSKVPSKAWRTRLSMIVRKAVRVLPEPVGEQSSKWSPFIIDGIANFCGSVKSGNLSLNQLRTGWHNFLDKRYLPYFSTHYPWRGACALMPSMFGFCEYTISWPFGPVERCTE